MCQVCYPKIFQAPKPRQRKPSNMPIILLALMPGQSSVLVVCNHFAGLNRLLLRSFWNSAYKLPCCLRIQKVHNRRSLVSKKRFVHPCITLYKLKLMQ